MNQKTINLKYYMDLQKGITPTYPEIKKAWQTFSSKLLKNIDTIEARIIKEDAEARNAGIIFTERKKYKDKLKQCKKYRDILNNEKQWNLHERDFETMAERGFDYYFQNYICLT